MLEFLQTYGTWIFFGLALLFMFRMHSGRGHAMSGGCGMGGHQPGDAHEDDSQPARLNDDGTPAIRSRPVSADAAADGRGGHPAGCH